jgi:PAS domain S-box-containing protein
MNAFDQLPDCAVLDETGAAPRELDASLFRHLLDLLPGGAGLVCGPDFSVRWIAGGCACLLQEGIDCATAPGKPLSQVIRAYAKNDLQAVFSRAAKRRETQVLQYRLRGERGFRYWHWSVSPLPAQFQTSGLPADSLLFHCSEVTESVLAEQQAQARLQAVQLQGKLLDLIQSNTPDLAFMFDVSGRFVHANPAVLKLLRQSPEHLIGRNFFEIDFPPSLARLLHRQIGQAVCSAQQVKGEISLSVPDGTAVTYECILVPVQSEDGGVEAIVGTGRDISAHKARQKELEDSDFRLSRALEAASAEVWDWDMAQDQVRYFGRSRDILGLPECDDGGIEARRLRIHPEDLAKSDEALRACLEGRTDLYVCCYRFRDRAGNWRWLLDRGMAARRDEQGKALRMIGTSTDVTESTQAALSLQGAHEELEWRVQERTTELRQANSLLNLEIGERNRMAADLAASSERLQSLFNAVACGLILHDRYGNYIEANAAAEQILGLPRDKLVGNADLPQLVSTVYEDGSPFQWDSHPAMIALRTGQPQRNVVMGIYRQDASLIWISVNVQPMFDEQGEPCQAVCSFVDITERKHTEEALWQSHVQLRRFNEHHQNIKEEERKRIARDIHDDLGQNLLALKIHVTILNERLAQSDPMLRGDVGRILNQINAAIGSVRTIMNNLRPPMLDELGLYAAVQWQLRQFQEMTGIDCSLVAQEKDFNTELDNDMASTLYRIIQESLANIARHASASRVEVALSRDRCHLHMSIADNGIGMRLSDRNKRSSFGLLGIEERMHALGGIFTINSSPGKGTTLSIFIPAQDKMLDFTA